MPPIRVLRHCADEPLGNLGVVLRDEGFELEVIDCFADGWPAVERAGFDPQHYAGLVVMGGPMNVDQTDRYRFLAVEVEWLQAAVAAELPILGVCLGAQLLAKSLGSPVRKNHVKEIGWYEIDLEPAARDDKLFAGSQPREPVFEWHGDTFDLPPGAVLLASGATCRIQAFRFGPCAYAVQFHPEITAQMVNNWLEVPGMCAEVKSLDYIDAAEIRGRAPVSLAAIRPLSQRILRGFAALCKARIAAR